MMLGCRQSSLYLINVCRPKPSTTTIFAATFASATKQLQKGGDKGKAAAKPKKAKKAVVLKQKKPPPRRVDPLHHIIARVGYSKEYIQKYIDKVKRSLGQQMPTVNPRWIWMLLNQNKITEEQREQLFSMVREGVPLYKSPCLTRRWEKLMAKHKAAQPQAETPVESAASADAQLDNKKAETDTKSADEKTETATKATETGEATPKSELGAAQGKIETKATADLTKPYWFKEKADYKKELKRIKRLPQKEDYSEVDESGGGLYRVFPKKEQKGPTPKTRVKPSDRPKNLATPFLYTKLINHYLSKQMWDKVEEIVQKMKVDDKVDRGAYYFMLSNALEHAPERVDGIVQDMKSVGIPLDKDAYARYIAFYDNKNDEQKMLEIFDKMKAEDITPTQHSYTRLVARYLRKGDYNKALEVHKEMGSKRIKLNAFILSSFLDGLVAKTIPDSVYNAFIKEIRAQTGGILNLAHKLANKADAEKLAVLDDLRKKLHYNGFFKHKWEIFSRIKQNDIKRKQDREAAAGQPATTEAKQ